MARRGFGGHRATEALHLHPRGDNGGTGSHRRIVGMARDQIRYDLLTQAALKGVVRTVLTRAASNGLPGDHHFYIAFDTRADGVGMSGRLREQYPEEMTIVLQHQFWGLEVGEEHFEVQLSFNNVPEHLFVPFNAIKCFYDPCVQFGLQFDAQEVANSDRPADAEARRPGGLVPTHPPAADGRGGASAPDSAALEVEANDVDDSADIVQLDSFRRK